MSEAHKDVICAAILVDKAFRLRDHEALQDALRAQSEAIANAKLERTETDVEVQTV